MNRIFAASTSPCAVLNAPERLSIALNCAGNWRSTRRRSASVCLAASVGSAGRRARSILICTCGSKMIAPANTAPGAIIFEPQVHIKMDRTLLPADPTLAAKHTDALRRLVERQFPAQFKAMDNLSGAFKTAQGDVLAAKILFIFLGLPGVALAAYLSKFAAELFADAQRREISLLRTRGATPAQITSIVAISSVLLAVGGSALGLVFGLALLLISGGEYGSVSPYSFLPRLDLGGVGNFASIARFAGLLLTLPYPLLPNLRAVRRE